MHCCVFFIRNLFLLTLTDPLYYATGGGPPQPFHSPGSAFPAQKNQQINFEAAFGTTNSAASDSTPFGGGKICPFLGFDLFLIVVLVPEIFIHFVFRKFVFPITWDMRLLKYWTNFDSHY